VEVVARKLLADSIGHETEVPVDEPPTLVV
jgi:hypothetical protein